MASHSPIRVRAALRADAKDQVPIRVPEPNTRTAFASRNAGGSGPLSSVAVPTTQIAVPSLIDHIARGVVRAWCAEMSTPSSCLARFPKAPPMLHGRSQNSMRAGSTRTLRSWSRTSNRPGLVHRLPSCRASHATASSSVPGTRVGASIACAAPSNTTLPRGSPVRGAGGPRKRACSTSPAASPTSATTSATTAVLVAVEVARHSLTRAIATIGKKNPANPAKAFAATRCFANSCSLLLRHPRTNPAAIAVNAGNSNPTHLEFTKAKPRNTATTATNTASRLRRSITTEG